MFNIAICDDEKTVCNSLEGIVDKYIKTNNISYNIDVFDSAKEMSTYIEDGKFYDLIFLDVEMEGMDGIEFGKFLRDEMKDDRTKIVYISWNSSYAMDLFKVRPVDFIIKPIIESHIIEVLDIVLKLMIVENEDFVYQIHG